jgi:hypothetical protein
MLSEELFHYTKAYTALEHILVQKQLKLPQLQFTNDPRESKELVFESFTGLVPGQSTGTVLNRIQNIAKSIKLKEWKVLCFSQNHPDLVNEKSTINNNPFLSGSYRPTMWAHYGGTLNGQHNGVCLKFTKGKLDAQIQKTFEDKAKYVVHSGEVEYDDEKLFDLLPLSMDRILELKDSEIEKRVRDYFFTYFREVFFRKSKDWENEYEYRWLIHSKNDAPEYVSIEGVLEEVLVGQDFPQIYEPSLTTICKELGIPAKRIRWVNGVPDERFIYSHLCV